MKESNSRIEMLKLLRIPAALLFLSFLGFLAVKMNYAEEIAGRNLNEKPAYRTPSKAFKKPHGAIEIEISNQNVEPLLTGQSTELIGKVTARRDLAQVDITWHLPAGVERLDGVQKQSLSNLHTGETQQVSIRVISHSDVNQQIHLEASYQQGDLKIGNTSQFNTLDQQNAKMYSHAQSEGAKIWQ